MHTPSSKVLPKTLLSLLNKHINFFQKSLTSYKILNSSLYVQMQHVRAVDQRRALVEQTLMALMNAEPLSWSQQHHKWPPVSRMATSVYGLKHV